MTELDIKEVERKIDKYFVTHTKEEIREDLIKCGMEPPKHRKLINLKNIFKFLKWRK